MVVEILGAKNARPLRRHVPFRLDSADRGHNGRPGLGVLYGRALGRHVFKLDRLYWSIVAAAAYLCLAVLIIEPVAYAFLQFKLAIGTLFTSAFLFLLPLALLAMTGPFFIRVLTSNLNGVGGTSAGSPLSAPWAACSEPCSSATSSSRTCTIPGSCSPPPLCCSAWPPVTESRGRAMACPWWFCERRDPGLWLLGRGAQP